MNVRELVAQLAPFANGAEVKVCVHSDVLTVCGESVRQPNPIITRERATGDVLLHLELWTTERAGRAILRLVRREDDDEG